jgi:hypothetical protein
MAPAEEPLVEEPAEGADDTAEAPIEEPVDSADDIAAAPAEEPLTEEPAEGTDDMAAAPAEEPAEGTGDMAAAPAEEPLVEEPAEGTDVAEVPAEEPAAGTDIAQAPVEEPVTGTDPNMAPTDQATAPVLTDLDAGSVSTEQLIGATVYAQGDENVGEIGDIRLMADGSGVDAVIIDVGGFLGMGEKPVALAFEALTFRMDESESIYVYTDFTREELDAAPEYDEAAYEAERDTMRLSMRE